MITYAKFYGYITVFTMALEQNLEARLAAILENGRHIAFLVDNNFI